MKVKSSLMVLVFSALLIFFIKVRVVSGDELSWDVFGYYLYLPATFIHHDPMLKDTGWIHEVMTTYAVSGTLYQVTQGPENNTIYFFLMGMSILYAPFFLLGHLFAHLTGSPADGFSPPYQYTLAMGMVVYTVAGLFFLRKILQKFFSDGITALVMVIIVLGTNYLHFATVKNLETANELFMLIVFILWGTIRWHEEQKLKHLLLIAGSTALCLLVKPSEVVCLLIPLWWGVYNRNTILEKWKLIRSRHKQFIIAGSFGLLLILPQMLYWKAATGSFVYDSYKNPGVGLDFLSPHFFQVLFSFRKGWLLYTPVMIFALAGFFFLFRKNKAVFVPVVVYFLISLYIVSSWTEWWYGGGYGMRPLIPSYVVLSLPLGFMLSRIAETRKTTRAVWTGLVSLLVTLNLFQTWQFNNGILDPYRTTGRYYLAVFGKTQIAPETRNLLSLERSFTAGEIFNDEANYSRRNIGYYDFSETDTNFHASYLYDSLSQSRVFRLDSAVSFSPNILTTFSGLTGKEYAWIRGSVDIYIPEGYHEELPCLVMTFARKEGAYKYRTSCLNRDQVKYNQWNRIRLDYLTPEPRSINDRFQAYVWHRGKKPVYIDNFKADVFEPKW